MKRQLSIEMLATIVLGLLFLACAGFQLYAVNKGFDITDEGYNVQLMQSKYIGVTNTYFFEAFKLFLGWVPHTLFAYRIASLWLLCFSNCVFVYATLRYFTIPFKFNHVLFCLLSIPFASTLDAVTINYNSAAAAFTLLAAACYFMAASIHTHTFKSILFYVLAGFFTGAICVSKITSGLAVLLVVGVFVLFANRLNVKAFLFYVLGFVVYHIIHGLFFTPFFTQLQQITEASTIFKQIDAKYSAVNILLDAYEFIRVQCQYAVVFILFFAGYRVVPKQFKSSIFVAAHIYLTYFFFVHEFKLTGLVYILYSMLCLGFLLVSHISKTMFQTFRISSYLVHIGLLLFLPLAVVLGTNNDYHHNYIFATVPLAVLAIVIFTKYQDVIVMWQFNFSLVLVSCLITYVCYTKILFEPYRILPLSQQQISMQNISVFKNLKLDSATANRFDLVHHTLHKNGFTPQHGLICIGKMQGLMVVMEASSPGGVLFSPSFKELYFYNLAHDTLTYSKPYYLLSDAPVAAESFAFHSVRQQFDEALQQQAKQIIKWDVLDSIPFETAPLGKLFVYKTNE